MLSFEKTHVIKWPVPESTLPRSPDGANIYGITFTWDSSSDHRCRTQCCAGTLYRWSFGLSLRHTCRNLQHRNKNTMVLQRTLVQNTLRMSRMSSFLKISVHLLKPDLSALGPVPKEGVVPWFRCQKKVPWEFGGDTLTRYCEQSFWLKSQVKARAPSWKTTKFTTQFQTEVPKNCESACSVQLSA